MPCLERLGVNERAGDAVECPLCSHKFRLPQPGFVGLPRDAFVEELTEVNKMVDQALSETQCDSCFETATSARSLNGVCVVSSAVVHCVDCVQNLCVSCCSRICKTQSTHDDVKTARHNVVDLSTHLSRTLTRGVRYCDRHADEPVTTYCFDCRVALCGCCASGRTHRFHRCMPLDEAATEFSQQLQRDFETVVDRRRRCVDETERVQQERRQFVDTVEKTAASIRQTEERIKHLITEHANKLMQQLETLKTETMQKVDAIQSDMDRFLAVADNFLQYAETLQERGTAVDVTRSGDDLLVRAATLRKMPFTETGGEMYKTLGVSFTPWYDIEELLANDDDNVVGRITSVSRSQAADATLSSQCSLAPTVVQTMLEDSRAVLGIAAISGHVYVARAESPDIEVYSAVTWSLKRRLPLAGLRSPTDLVACEPTGCLFVADWAECRVHRVDVRACRRRGVDGAATNGGADSAQTPRTELSTENRSKDEETGWWMAERPWSLSLVEGQRHCTILVTCDQAAKLYEYTEFGSVVRQVCLAAELSNPRHAVLLSTGQFVVSFKDSVCLVSADGRRVLPNKTSAPTGGRISCCGRLAVDDCGGLLVLDVEGRRVVQFDAGAELRLVREVVTRDARLRYPARLCVDRRRRRLYVADNELSQRTRLQTKFWGKTGRVVVYDIHPS